MSDFTDQMEELGPVGWWRLGESHATPLPDAKDEVDNNHNPGTYVDLDSDDFGQTGAIAGDSDTAIEVEASGSEYVEVPDSGRYSLSRAHDEFGRSTSWGSSWGTADYGGSWTAQVSTSDYYRCNGSHALIDQTNSAATWQQGLSVSRKDYDLQVRVRWNDHADGQYITPLTLVARRQDNSNYYGAELRENTDEGLDLRVIKKDGGTYTLIASVTDLADYDIDPVTGWGDWWYVRFQLDGSSLRAKAWKMGTDQPASWDIDTTDTAHDTAGTVAIRSSNSGSDARPTVQFDDFRVHTLGLTVHAWMRPDDLEFEVGEGGGEDGHWVHWLGKGDNAPHQHEWAFRLYSDDGTNEETKRENRVSAYMFNLSGGEGAGAYFQGNLQNPEDPLVEGTRYQFVATFDPGDALDLGAGVTLWKDGVKIQGPPSAATLYSHEDYQVFPKNGTAPVRFGTEDKTTNSFLTGGLDEIAIFDRKLTDEEIEDLYEAAT